MRKFLFLLIPFVAGCSSVRLVQTDHGRVVDQAYRPVDIVGNPRLTCFNKNNDLIADGFFVYQKDNGDFVIDEFGVGYKTVSDPRCIFNSND